jgi:hypothetical protein
MEDNSKNKLTSDEINDLRKSLIDLGMKEEEIESQIQKAIGEKEKEDDDEGKEKSPEDVEEKKSIYKSMKDRMDTLQKSLKEFEDMYGSMLVSPATPNPSNDLKKSIEDDIKKSFLTDIEKSISDSVGDIQKSINDSFESINSKFDSFSDLLEIAKSIKEDVKKIGDAPVPGKSMLFGKANFFEKGIEDDINERQLSVSKDKDTIIKSMQDLIEKSTDNDIKEVLMNGVSEYTINSGNVTDNTVKALTLLSKKENITFVK